MTFQWEDAPGVELRKKICTYTAEDPDKAYRFVNDVDHAKAKILRDPEAPRQIEPNFRKMRLESFPYTLVYTIIEDTVWVIAFVHNSRHQDYWKRIS